MTGALPPLVEPGPPLTPEQARRYARHALLPGIGVEGQRRLLAARVLVIGAGGLGSPALLYLAAAGVGTIGVVDDDVVDVSNLQRQVVHGVSDVGRPKVESARDTIAALDPDIEVRIHRCRLTAQNALDILGDYDLVLDGADNFATRYLVADATEILRMPCVWGSILRFDGQVSVFWPGHGPVYRDIFPEPPDPALVPSCAEAGVFGVLCAAIGAAMGTEAIKLIAGIGRPLVGRLLVHDALAATWRELALRPDPARVPVTRLQDLAVACAVPAGVGGDDGAVDADELAVLLAAGEILLVDVREDVERELSVIDGSLHLRKDDILTGAVELPRDRDVVLHCAAGSRSAIVLDHLRRQGYDRVRHLAGGIDAWVNRVDGPPRDPAPHP